MRLPWYRFGKEIELDLNGHTLTLQGDNARLYFKRANITITSSGSNEGTITGSYQYGKDRFKGDGLITVERNVLTIEHVTIKMLERVPQLRCGVVRPVPLTKQILVEVMVVRKASLLFVTVTPVQLPIRR